MSGPSEFDWHEEENSIVVFEQAAIAVYTNSNGHIVIRQAGQYGPDEDTDVVIAPENIGALVRALYREAGIETSVPVTKPMTNAARQRAYRQRRRNVAVTPRVTDSNGNCNDECNGSAHDARAD